MPTTRQSGHSAPVPLPVAPGDARRELRALLSGSRWCADVDSVVLAVHEALINAYRHGGGALRLQACVEGDALVVIVCDRGRGFEISSPEGSHPTAASDPFAENGRGLSLIRQIASWAETCWDRGDFCLRMGFESPAATPAGDGRLALW